MQTENLQDKANNEGERSASLIKEQFSEYDEGCTGSSILLINIENYITIPGNSYKTVFSGILLFVKKMQ